MKIVADENIPFLKDSLEGMDCEKVYLKGDAISADDVRDADILLIRTRTHCDSSLLDDSRCAFIGTATIGTDHIDLEYCHKRGITVANAPGCNAPGVAQHVLTAVKTILMEGETFSDKTIGIIGEGNVGSLVRKWAESLGMRVLVNDPPKYGDSPKNTPLSTIARECDIITIHTPLTHEGAYPTYHIINEEFLNTLQRRPLLINSARGAVIDTVAVKRALKNGTLSAAAIDCWEGEPNIDTELLDMAIIATPHIAGYSYEGKVRATAMIIDALTSHLKRNGETQLPAPLNIQLNPIPDAITPEMLAYDILADTTALKSATGSNSLPTNTVANLHASEKALVSTFESLRNTYPLRHEPGQA